VLTVGIDLAAEPERTGMAWIDCPLSWPADFVAFVTAHENARRPLPPTRRDVTGGAG
jgi:hypothetical protein